MKSIKSVYRSKVCRQRHYSKKPQNCRLFIGLYMGSYMQMSRSSEQACCKDHGRYQALIDVDMGRRLPQYGRCKMLTQYIALVPAQETNAGRQMELSHRKLAAEEIHSVPCSVVTVSAVTFCGLNQSGAFKPCWRLSNWGIRWLLKFSVQADTLIRQNLILLKRSFRFNADTAAKGGTDDIGVGANKWVRTWNWALEPINSLRLR